MNLFYQPRLADGVCYLSEDESRHAVKVLRKKTGDRITITDGKGFFYECLIAHPDSHRCTFDIHKKIKEPEKNFKIHIAISPTKNADRIEWFVEKAVELGVHEITLIECDHTERHHIKVERLIKMAISAMKQSLKAELPIINPLTSFREIMLASNASETYIAHVDNENSNHLKNLATPNSSYLVLVGPEGDFSEEELMLADAREFKKVSLGQARLRTETAGIAACHILNLANTP